VIIIRKNAHNDFYLVSLNGGLDWIRTSKKANTLESLIEALKSVNNEIVVED